MALRKALFFHTTFGNYTASEILGEGGSGRVYKVTDESGDIYALKLLHSSVAIREKLKRFKNELIFCQKNQHPNIISVVDHGVYINNGDSAPFYVMHLYNGSLRTMINARITPDRVLGYFGQLLDGVEAAHLQGIVHRDLKPENILIDPKTDHLVVADFGIARFREEQLYTAVETAPNERLANFEYAAPEQRRRGVAVDLRADIYSLGLILNEMYTGEVPWGTGYKVIASIAPEHSYLDEIVSIMLRQSPEDRPASIESIKQQLIGRKQEFIVRQHLSELKQTVIPITEIDDPLIIDPPRLVNFDYDHNVVTLFFQQPVNEKWRWALTNMGGHESLWGKGPERFEISGKQARINAEEREVQAIIDYFKRWLPIANRVYEQRIRQEKRDAEEQSRTKLQREIEEQERRQRVLKNVKF